MVTTPISCLPVFSKGERGGRKEAPIIPSLFYPLSTPPCQRWNEEAKGCGKEFTSLKSTTSKILSILLKQSLCSQNRTKFRFLDDFHRGGLVDVHMEGPSSTILLPLSLYYPPPQPTLSPTCSVNKDLLSTLLPHFPISPLLLSLPFPLPTASRRRAKATEGEEL